VPVTPSTVPFALRPVAAFVIAVAAAPAAFAAPVAWDLPAQPLDRALAQVARQTGLQLLLAPDLVGSRQSPALRGTLEVDDALARLLQGSGLRARIDGHTLVVERAGEPSRESTLPAVRVSASGESANGPGNGYVAQRSLSGTKTDTSLATTPQTVTVVTRDQMTDQDVRSVAQALRYSAGVFTEYRGASNLHDEMFVRGFYYVPRFYNGLVYGSGSFGQIDPYLLDRVEVVRGPASVLFGQASPGGLVNLSGKLPATGRPNEVTATVGTQKRLGAGLDVGGAVPGQESLSWRAVAMAERSDQQEDGLEQQRYALAPSIAWRPDARTEWVGYALFQHEPDAGFRNFREALGTLTPTTYGFIPREFLVSDAGYDRSKREQAAVGYQFRHAFDGGVTFRQNLRVNSIDTDYRTLTWGSLGADERTISRTASGGTDDLLQFVMDNQVQADVDTSWARHRLLAGLDLQWSRRDYQWGMNWSTTPSIDWVAPVYGIAEPALNPTSDDKTRATQLGLYLQDQATIGALTVVAGGRYDTVRSRVTDDLPDGSEQRLSPHAFTGRLGVLYTTASGLSPYASYSTSFEPVLESANGEPAFAPSKAEQVEVGVKYAPPSGLWFATAAAYDMKQRNVLFYDYATSRYFQTGEIHNRGVELDVHAQATRQLEFTASYAYIDSRVTESVQTAIVGKTPARVPRDQVALWGKYTFADRVSVGAGMRRVGPSSGNADNTLVVPGVTLWDAMASVDLGQLDPSFTGLQLQLNGTNLADKVYTASCASAWACFSGAGRSVTATLRYQW